MDGELTPGRDASNKDWLAQLQKVMRTAQTDLAGIVSVHETTKPPEEQTTSAGSPDVAQRTQLALVRSAANGAPEVQLSEVLQDAGVTPEMFRQITERGDFATTFTDLNKRIFFLTRLPQMAAALSASAMAGNVKAFDSLVRFFGDQEGRLGGDLAGTVLHGSPESVLRVAERQHQELGELVDTLRASLEADDRRVVAEREAREAALRRVR